MCGGGRVCGGGGGAFAPLKIFCNTALDFRFNSREVKGLAWIPCHVTLPYSVSMLDLDTLPSCPFHLDISWVLRGYTSLLLPS